MKYCSFFGHRDCGDEVYQRIEEVIISLWERGEAEVFLVGNQGHFDLLVRKALGALSERYPDLKYYVVLAYLDRDIYDSLGDMGRHSIYPDGLETVPPRFAIDRRNRWMLERSDTVVCYVTAAFGNAHKYAEKGRQQGKRVINLAEKVITE